MNESLSIDSNEEKPGKKRRIWIILVAVLGGLVLMCIGTFYLMRATGFLEITNQAGSMSILVTQNQINHNAKMGRMEQSLPQVGKNTH
ncbi:MAG: hypothetical protein KGY69_19790 [Bacteroidales bacterium]|nr:hypothetical protein [Bacteroidales bacterium]